MKTPLNNIENLTDRQQIGTNLEYGHFVNHNSRWGCVETPRINGYFGQRIREKSVNSYIKFSVGGVNYALPSRLGGLVSTICSSIYILDLEDDWDGMEGEVISAEVYNHAIGALVLYSEYIYNNFDKIVISEPSINPVPNGSVDFSWRLNTAKLLMNIKKRKDLYFGTCYGFSTDSALSLEGLVDIESVDKEIARWMRKLKK